MNPATSPKVLMVDDEPNVLTAMRRSLGQHFNLVCESSGRSALQTLIASGPFAVVLTDMRMPEMDGLALITAARKISPESIYMMLTGNVDQLTAVNAINQGRIFRFLNKPCPAPLVSEALHAAIHQYELVTAERVLLKETLTGSLRLMVEALELTNPQLGIIQSLTKRTVPELCKALNLDFDWSLAVACTTCLVGLVTWPRIDKSTDITPQALDHAAAVGSKLLSHIPRISLVADMIAHQREPGPLPDQLNPPLKQDMVAIGSRLLRYAVDLSILQRSLGSVNKAIVQLRSEQAHDPRLLQALPLTPESREDPAQQIIEIESYAIRAGMILVSDVKRQDGQCLLTGGHQVTDLAAATIRSYALSKTIPERLQVRVPLA